MNAAQLEEIVCKNYCATLEWVTVDTIARLAGVSTATVRRIFNSCPGGLPSGIEPSKDGRGWRYAPSRMYLAAKLVPHLGLPD